MSKTSALAFSFGREFLGRLLRIATLLCAALGVLWFVGGWVPRTPDLAQGRQRAAELQARLRRQPQFAEVSVILFTNGQLQVLAPAALAPADRAELEQRVQRSMGDVQVSCIAPIPSGPR